MRRRIPPLILFTSGYHGQAERRRPHPCQPARQCRVAAVGLALGAGRPPRAHVAAVPRARPLRRTAREPCMPARRRCCCLASACTSPRSAASGTTPRSGSASRRCTTAWHTAGRADELSALRLAVSGSAALPAALHRAIAAATGMAILERYGTTETLMTLSNPYDGERRAGTVGLPLPGVEIRFDSTGDAARPRGPAVFAQVISAGPTQRRRHLTTVGTAPATSPPPATAATSRSSEGPRSS